MEVKLETGCTHSDGPLLDLFDLLDTLLCCDMQEQKLTLLVSYGQKLESLCGHLKKRKFDSLNISEQSQSVYWTMIFSFHHFVLLFMSQ